MTTANKITITRIALIPVFVTFAFLYGSSVQSGEANLGLRIIALVTFALAALSDGLDGYVARHYHQISRLGILLDPLADKALMLSAVFTLSFAHWPISFPVWFTGLVFIREFIILNGIAILHHINGKVPIKPHWISKTCTVLQMSAIVWIMLDFRTDTPPPMTLIYIAGFFTILSALHYILEGVRQIKEHGKPLPGTDADGNY